MAKFKVGDIIVFNVNGCRYEVSRVALYFYGLKFMPDEKHSTCILRTVGTAGTIIDYVDNNFRKLTKLEKALK